MRLRPRETRPHHSHIQQLRRMQNLSLQRIQSRCSCRSIRCARSGELAIPQKIRNQSFSVGGRESSSAERRGKTSNKIASHKLKILATPAVFPITLPCQSHGTGKTNRTSPLFERTASAGFVRIRNTPVRRGSRHASVTGAIWPLHVKDADGGLPRYSV